MNINFGDHFLIYEIIYNFNFQCTLLLKPAPIFDVAALRQFTNTTFSIDGNSTQINYLYRITTKSLKKNVFEYFLRKYVEGGYY